ncbi:hypothetical protein VP01_185g8 [Puccinia sorghi]|uniref:DUF4219 domain-containing protein n=1 Tax=Puccinia sorghi TaxID=27349 RepID=A0A0L6VDF3_9BASI|nr:hypothetical protein VP01_185g8 [Puccinia sorghi]
MADNEGGSSKPNIPKLDDTNYLHWSMRMKAHLRHKGLTKYITEAPAALVGAAADAVNKKHAETSDTAAALMHESKKGKKKKRGPYCAPGKHNPEATSHDADHCWQLHPEQRPPTKLAGSHSGQTPTTQLVEVEDGHESEVSLLLTEAASKPTVLDSGATHHLVNNPDAF